MPSPTYKRTMEAEETDDHPEGHFEEFVGNIKACIALYVECVPHASAMHSEIKPHHREFHDKNKAPLNKPIVPLNPLFRPDKVPAIVAEFNQTIHHSLKPSSATAGQYEDSVHWPWSASIYVSGKLVCVGVLLDRSWVITESTCLKLVRYVTYLSIVNLTS